MFERPHSAKCVVVEIIGEQCRATGRNWRRERDKDANYMLPIALL